MTVFDISKFASNVSSGFTRTNLFIVQISTPPFYEGSADFLQFLCSSSQLPGISLDTSSQKLWGYGPSQNIPHGASFQPINMTFYSDGDGKMLQFFNDWTQSIVSYGNKASKYKGAPYAELQYPENYYTTIDILYYSPVGTDPYLCCYHLTEAYPMGVSPINVNWASTGQLAQITVPITYRNYEFIPNISEAGVISNTVGNPEFYSSLPSGQQTISSPSISITGVLEGFTSILQTVGNGVGSLLNGVSSLNNMAQQVIRPISIARTIGSQLKATPDNIVNQLGNIGKSI